nr:aldose epimerase family protein [Staphylococcus carnosus]
MMFTRVEHQRNGLDLIKIDNDEAKIVFTNYGARIVSWKYEDNNIVLGNVVEADEFYQENSFYFGASVGRYGGRIADGKFELDNQTYQLEQNDPPSHLHGGSNGIDRHLFDYEIKDENGGYIQIIFTTTIKEADDHYPGDIKLKIIHTYDIDNRWSIEYYAESDQTTLFNPTNHVYFNLNRDNKEVDNHYFTSDKLNIHLLNDQNLPEAAATLDLVNLFNKNKIRLTEMFESENARLNEQMETYKGLDHPFSIGDELIVENSQFLLKMKTDMPNVVVFTFNDTSSWKSDMNIYKAHSGFTLEAQNLPNDINLFGKDAPSILQKDQAYYSRTTYQIIEKLM